ncbi:hypothetical protein [Chryseobacterium wanjuense]
MKKLLFAASLAFLFVACDKVKMDVKTTKSEEWKPVDSATATKAWMDYATPGEMHKMLAKSDGAWIRRKHNVDGKWKKTNDKHF